MKALKKISIYFLLFIQFFVLPLQGQEAEKKEAEEKSVIQINKIEENKQVSLALPHIPHYGIVFDTNPANPKNLAAGGIIFPAEYAHPSIAIYVSFDGGSSWEIRSILPEGIKKEGENPILAFDLDGTAYFSYLETDRPRRENSSYPVSLFRSEDGGRTWSNALKAEREYLFDYHYLLTDQSGSKNAHCLYLVGTEIAKKVHNDDNKKLSVYYSKDKGSTFKGPAKLIDGVGSFNGRVLSDGTLVILYTRNLFSKQKGYHDGSDDELLVITSQDNGKSYSSPVVVTDIHKAKKSAVSDIPSIAIDNSSGPFRDRIYATWLDARRGCYDVYLSWSSDKGKTWSTPVIINDNPLPANPQEGPDHTCPAVAVNKEGVVGVLWYDRRDDGFSKESIFSGLRRTTESLIEHDNRWQIYFSASLDGGESFLPNVKVSTALFSNNAPGNWVPMARRDKLSFYLPQNIYPGAGKAGCFAASSDGQFRALWVDSRTGVSQIWTVPIEVVGQAFPGGSSENASLEDVSPWIRYEVTDTKFLPRDRVFELYVQIQNKSSDQTLISPLKIYLLEINSGYGSWEIIENDNKKKGVGAIWDFTNLLPNGKLKPGELSGKKRFFLKLKDEVPPSALRFRQFLDLRTKAFGRIES
jgi:hypothetical protein